MFCKKHQSTKMYLGKLKAEQCGHETRWKYQKYCELCSKELGCCQECGEPISKITPPNTNRKET